MEVCRQRRCTHKIGGKTDGINSLNTRGANFGDSLGKIALNGDKMVALHSGKKIDTKYFYFRFKL